MVNRDKFGRFLHGIGKHNEETKKKISKSLMGHSFHKGGEKGWFKKGHNTWNTGKKGLQSAWNKGLPKEQQPCYGRHLSEEHKNIIRLSKLGNKNPSKREDVKIKMSLAKQGNKSLFWKGGKSFEIYPQEFNRRLKEEVRKMWGYECVSCGINQNKLNQKLHIHHINENKKDNNKRNLLPLCSSCHKIIGIQNLKNGGI